MQQLATGLLGIGLVITCLAGYRVLLFGVDLITGMRDWQRPKRADLILMALAIFGVACLAAGLSLLHSVHPGAL